MIIILFLAIQSTNNLSYNQPFISSSFFHFCLLRGPNVFKGYYKMEDKTNETIQDGWLCSGDVGKLKEKQRDNLLIILPFVSSLFFYDHQSKLNDQIFIFFFNQIFLKGMWTLDGQLVIIDRIKNIFKLSQVLISHFLILSLTIYHLSFILSLTLFLI